MASSYLPPFPNLIFQTVFVASSINHYSKSVASRIVAAFAVTSTSFFNSSLQANVVSRMEVDRWNFKLVELFLLTSTTTSNNLSTIQMTPVLHLRNMSHPRPLINKLKNSTYFSRSLRHLSIKDRESCRVLPALENLVALEVLNLRFTEDIPKATEPELSVISRLHSLVDLNLVFGATNDNIDCFNFLGDLENNDNFRKLSLDILCENPRHNFRVNFARLCAKNRLTHLSLVCIFGDEGLDVLIGAKLSNLRFLSFNGGNDVPSGKVADAIIASSSSLTRLEIFHISDECLIKCAEYLENLIELQVVSEMVNGSFLRERGSCFSSTLEILDLSWSCLSDEYLKDGFKFLTSLRKLSSHFTVAASLPFLTCATFLEELKLDKINAVSLEAIGQLTQLKCLQVAEVEGDVKSEDVTHLKSLVNLRKLTFALSTKQIYDGILPIAECFPKLVHGEFTYNTLDKSKGPKFSRDQVTYLLEKCWPMVRYAVFEYDNVSTVMPYLRQRFPHVSFGDRDEEVARKNGALISPSSNVPAHRPRSP